MKAKRILAFAICLCMAMSILPMGASATGAEGVNIDFSTVDVSEVCLVSQTGGYISAQKQPAHSDYPELGTFVYWGLDGYEGRWLAYSLGSLKAGNYEGTLTALPGNCGSEWSFWIVPKTDSVDSVNSAIAAATPAAVANNYDANVKYYNSYNSTPINTDISASLPSDGEYMLVAKATGGYSYKSGSAGKIHRFNLKALTLKKRAEVTYTDSLDIDFTSTAAADWKYGSGAGVSPAAGKWLQVTTPTEAWFAYDLGGIVAGNYEATVSCVPYSGGATFNFYIIPRGTSEEITAALATATPVVKLDGYSASSANAANVSKKSGAFSVAANGEYMIVAKFLEGNGYSAALPDMRAILLKGLQIGAKKEVVYNSSVNIAFKDTTTANYIVSRAGYCGMVPMTYAPDKCAEMTSYPEDWMAYDLGGLKAGYYTGDVTSFNWKGGSSYNFYIIPKTDEASEIAAAISDALPVATADGYAEDVDYWTAIDANGSDPSSINFTLDEDGEYMLVIKYESGDHPVKAGVGGTWVYGILLDSFNASVFAQESDTAAADILGDNYAYIRKNGEAWAVNFFGGVKEIDGYTAVGFEVSYTAANGAKVVLNQDSNNVYASLNVGGDTVAASAFGTGVEYVFGEVFEIDDIDTSKPVFFKSYAVDIDENVIYGINYYAVIE